MDAAKKILIADDHSIVSRGIRYIISSNFPGYTVSEVPSLHELLKRLAAETFTHLILDLNLDDGNSLDILPQITEKYPDLFILIYTMASEEVFGKKLMQFNVSGFLSKKSDEAEIIRAMQIFLQGGIFVSRKLKTSMNRTKSENAGDNAFLDLSITELKVLGFILKGHKTKEIAVELKVTQQTIATFKSRIFKKLSTENIFEIQKMAELHNVSFS